MAREGIPQNAADDADAQLCRQERRCVGGVGLGDKEDGKPSRYGGGNDGGGEKDGDDVRPDR